MSIEETLQQRGNKYGAFDEHARITQNIKEAMVDSKNWPHLPPDMKEALEMVAHKVGRILNGDPNYHDSWHDIIGYVKLVADRLEKGEEEEKSPMWQPFRATPTSVCPVHPDTIVTVMTPRTMVERRIVVGPAYTFHWKSTVHPDECIIGYGVVGASK